MNCEDVELELSGSEPSLEARAHLADCASCQATARLLGLATLPPLTQNERLLLNGLSASTHEAWRARRSRGEGLRRFASLALAAGLGALLASAVLVKTLPRAVPAEPQVRTVLVAAPEVPVLDFDGANLSDDEVFFEVGWPSPTEGDL
ncbi:MAG: hypothetical protein Q8L48_17495 [Archangium sp.]|nr:hypothetical protein [Archangium sp.]